MALLVNVPVADGLTFAVTVYTIVLPTGILTVSLILPVPDPLKLLAPPVELAVQVSLVMPAGKLSVIVPPVTACGPLLVTTMV